MQNTITLSLDINQLNLVMASLGKMPFESVFDLVENVRKQVGPQIQQLQQAAASEPEAELKA
jgi:hypothetical protein